MMIDRAELSAAAARLYDVAALRQPWEPLLDVMRRATGSRGMWVQALHMSDRPITCTELAPVVDYYLDTMAAIDVRAREGLRNRQLFSRFTTDPEFIDFDQRDQRDYYRAYLQPNGCDWCGAYVMQLPDLAPVAFTFQRNTAQGPFQRDELRALDRLIPHLRRVMTLSASIGEARDSERLDALQSMRVAAALCDSTGRIMRLNAAFEDLLGGGLDLVDRHLHAGDPRASSAVAAMIRQTTLAGLGLIVLPPQPVVIPMVDGRRVTLTATPVEGAMRDLFRVGKVLLTAQVATPVRPDIARLAARFGLTPAEARLAARLAAGDALQTAADRLGVTYGTARQYLKSVFAKTETHRQAELVARLLSGH
jgi:DNA-binding CsgD family transcriptional regulator